MNRDPENNTLNLDPEEISLRITLSLLRALLERTERTASTLYLEQQDGPSHKIHTLVLSALEQAKNIEGSLEPSSLIQTEVYTERTIGKIA
ncbi:MAG: hypothetical protein AAFR42_21065 [Cyanobacteria bacterium J06628_6]